VSDTYKLWFALHIASIIVAFAPVIVGAVAAAPAGRRATVPQLSYLGRIVYSGGLILAGLFGILLILASDDVWKFDQMWVSLDRHERRVPRHDLPLPPRRPDRSVATGAGHHGHPADRDALPHDLEAGRLSHTLR
jgi:hypothetical protein